MRHTLRRARSLADGPENSVTYTSPSPLRVRSLDPPIGSVNLVFKRFVFHCPIIVLEYHSINLVSSDMTLPPASHDRGEHVFAAWRLSQVMEMKDNICIN